MPNNKTIIIPDIFFHKLWDFASEFDTFDEYTSFLLNSSSKGYISFKRKYKIEIDKAYELLKIIYKKNHLSFNDILKETKLHQSDISHIYCIPIKTIEKWVSETNRCPDYIRLIILRETGNFKLPRGIQVQSQTKYNKYPIKGKIKKQKIKEGNIKTSSSKYDLNEILKEYDKRREDIIRKTDYLDSIIKANKKNI